MDEHVVEATAKRLQDRRRVRSASGREFRVELDPESVVSSVLGRSCLVVLFATHDGRCHKFTIIDLLTNDER